jgi:hypothetical protein
MENPNRHSDFGSALRTSHRAGIRAPGGLVTGELGIAKERSDPLLFLEFPGGAAAC